MTPSEENELIADWELLLVVFAGWESEKARGWAIAQYKSLQDNPFLTHESTAYMIVRRVYEGPLAGKQRPNPTLDAKLERILSDFLRLVPEQRNHKDRVARDEVRRLLA